MHVLTITPFFPTAADDAAGCFVREPLAAMQDATIEHSVMAAQPMYRGRQRAKQSDATLPASWVHYPSLPSGVGLSSAGAFLFAILIARVRQLHHKHSIDLIHAHAALPCGHAAMLLSQELDIPFVVTVHGLDAYSTNQVHGHPGQWCKRVSGLVYRRASRVICISEKVRDQVLQGHPAAAVTTVIYNGADPQVFSPALCEPAANVVLSVGNLIAIKGHELLLRAIAGIHPACPNLHCEIIGDGPERPRLQRIVHQLNLAPRVRFLGRQSRSRVAEAMRRCTLFALPSRYEGLGCVYLEAMCAQKAAVACRGQGIEEVVQHGVSGWLVNPDDQEGLGGALRLLLQEQNLRRQIGTAAQQTILRGFTVAHQARRLADLYGECVA